MRQLAYSGAFLTAVVLAGCGAAAGGSGNGKVKGKVTHNGTPVAGARVMFLDGASTTGPAAITDDGGEYALVGLKPADYKVVVYKLVAKKGAVLPEDMDLEQIEASGMGGHALPKKYSTPTSTTLVVTVKGGSNDGDLKLEGK
jgi:uncharacterized protein YfaS (alpha-2-macroglobulin family)